MYINNPIPDGWKEIDVIHFEAVLLCAPDYTRDAFGNVTYYKVRHSGERFAAMTAYWNDGGWMNRYFIAPQFLLPCDAHRPGSVASPTAAPASASSADAPP
jgi:hypothetical protein